MYFAALTLLPQPRSFLVGKSIRGNMIRGSAKWRGGGLGPIQRERLARNSKNQIEGHLGDSRPEPIDILRYIGWLMVAFQRAQQVRMKRLCP